MVRLIERCICGASLGFREFARNDLPVAECGDCGVQHLITDRSPDDIATLYRGEYHASLDRHPGVIPYKQRYEHDRRVARLRLEKYQAVRPQAFGSEFRGLDVGAANGAWVDELNAQGLQATGVDPDPAMTRPTIEFGTVSELLDRNAGPFTFVTYHDVLEHIVKPLSELIAVRQLMPSGAMIVIDVPDVFVPAGFHHYKAEHLWYFTRDAVCRLLWRSRFQIHDIDTPVAGKFVVYGLAR